MVDANARTRSFAQVVWGMKNGNRLNVDCRCNVELEGVEPSSKQGNNTLSTCLFQPSFFVQQQDLDHQLMPYPLNFIDHTRLQPTISELAAPLNPQTRKKILGAMSRPITW